MRGNAGTSARKGTLRTSTDGGLRHASVPGDAMREKKEELEAIVNRGMKRTMEGKASIVGGVSRRRNRQPF